MLIPVFVSALNSVCSDCNWNRTHNYLVHKRTLNHFSQNGQIIELCFEYLSVQCIWLCALFMSRTQFRVNPLRSVWLNGWVLVYELSSCGFESSYSHLNFWFRVCFEQGVSWHSGNYRVWIHSETRTRHGNIFRWRYSLLVENGYILCFDILIFALWFMWYSD